MTILSNTLQNRAALRCALFTFAALLVVPLIQSTVSLANSPRAARTTVVTKKPASAVSPAQVQRAVAAANAAPDDYMAQLQAAWLLFTSRDNAAALSRYEKASKISDGSFASRLGMAWSLLRLGRRQQSHKIFTALHKGRADNRLVAAGLRASAPSATSWSVGLAPSGQVYDGHPFKTSSAGLDINAQFSTGGGWSGAALARYNWFGTLPSPFSTSTSFSQSELWLNAGKTTARHSIVAHYARIEDGDSYTGAFNVIGVSGWLRRTDTWSGQLSATLYPDRTVLRLAPSWRTVIAGIGLTPGLALQYSGASSVAATANDGAVGIFGSISLDADLAVHSIYLAGGVRIGKERRPTDLLVPVVFNVPDVVAGGLWLSATMPLGGPWWLAARYALTRYRSSGQRGDISSDGHMAGLTLSWRSTGSKK